MAYSNELRSTLDTIMVNTNNTAHNTSVLATRYEALTSKFDDLKRTITKTINTSSTFNSSLVIDEPVVKKTRQLRITEFVHNTSAVNASSSASLNTASENIRMLRLSQLTMSSLFFQWYSECLFNYVPTNQSDRDDIIKCAKLISYSMRFLPDNCGIHARPLTEGFELEKWRNSLREFSNIIEDKIANFLNTNLPSLKRKRDAKVDSTYKYLQQISLSLFPTPSAVFDNSIGNLPENRKSFYYADISHIKRKGSTSYLN